jgi:hypothetical protein
MLQLLERNAQAAGNTILGLLAALSMDGFERNGQWQKMRYPARRKEDASSATHGAQWLRYGDEGAGEIPIW